MLLVMMIIEAPVVNPANEGPGMKDVTIPRLKTAKIM